MRAHPADTDFSLNTWNTDMWGFLSAGPFSSAPKCPHKFGPCGRCLSRARWELQVVVAVVVVQDRWDVQQWPRMSSSWCGQPCWLLPFLVCGELAGQAMPWECLLGCVCVWNWITGAAGPWGSIPGFLFARSICGWHAAAIEMWRHRDGGRGLLLVQSVDKAALWRICIFKLGFWTTEKPDLIKEHLKRYKGISRNDTYYFSLEQNLSLSLCWLHTSSVELVGFCKAGFKLALW